MALVIGKKLIPTIALAAVLFFSCPSISIGQNTGFDEVSEGIDNVTGGTGGVISQNGQPADSGENGGPSAGRRLGFTGWREDMFNILSSLGALIAWLGGFLLDASISIFTVGMYDTTVFFKLDQTIEAMWGVIRDMFNLLFIFGLIYAGFKLILGDDSSKRMIGSIVVAALLINFSLYVTQVVVDFTNVMAYQINSLIQPAETTQVMNGWSVSNISTNFTQLTQLDQLGSRSQEVAERAGLGGAGSDTMGAAIVLGLLFTVFYSVLGFVFAAGGFILFGRFIALVFLMIFSPIIFLGSILPNFKTYSDQWKKLFFNQALVGPAFLFMLYLSLQALSGLGRMDQAEYTITNVTLYLLIVTAFVWGSLLVARSMSSWGALQAYNVGNYAQRKFGSLTSSMTARGLRGSAGRMASWGSKNESLRESANAGGLKGWVSKRTLNLSNNLKDASFDARNTKAGGKLGLGTGIKGGYETKTKNIIDREKKFADTLGTVDDDDPRVKELQAEADFNEQAVKKQKEAIRVLRKTNASPERIESAKATLEELEDKHNESKESVQSEKNRRQLGVVSKVGESAYLDGEVVRKKKEIKENMNRYVEALEGNDKANQESFKRAVMENKKELADLEKKRDESMGGYANAVEKNGMIKRFFLGRNKSQNKEAAKKIREEYKKKIKSKEKKGGDEKADKTEGKKEEKD